jgi:hypothetical protein
MKVKIIESHTGEGQFPNFKKGTAVTLKEECAGYLHWYACVIEGYQTYVPESFVSGGALARDYNPTELIAQTGDVLDVREIIHSWLVVVNEEGLTGWIPAEKVISL